MSSWLTGNFTLWVIGLSSYIKKTFINCENTLRSKFMYGLYTQDVGEIYSVWWEPRLKVLVVVKLCFEISKIFTRSRPQINASFLKDLKCAALRSLSNSLGSTSHFLSQARCVSGERPTKPSSWCLAVWHSGLMAIKYDCVTRCWLHREFKHIEGVGKISKKSRTVASVIRGQSASVEQIQFPFPKI